MKRRAILMGNSTKATVENMTIASADLASTIAELKASIASLNALVESLKSDNEYLKNNNDLLREENAYLKRKLFGVKSEKMPCSVEQLSLFDEAEQECEPEFLEEITYKRAKKKQKGTLEIKLDNLKHVKEVYDIDEKDRICDICGTKMHRVGEEFVRHEVVYEPAKLYVKDIYRKTYECRNCRKRGKVVMLKAGTPAPVIPHSFTSPSVLSQVITDKFVNHMPLYRQEAEWKRLGLDLSRTTMANWLITASREYFIPIVNRMHEILVEEKYLHSDETTVQVLNEPGKPATSKSYMWVYSSIRESSKPIRIFEYKPDRKAENPQKFLENFSGTLISDGYGGYNNIEGVVNAYCWAHARRKFRDSLPNDLENAENTLPIIAMNKIKKLFAIEKEIEALSPDKKVKIRQLKSKPLIDDFFSWCKSNQNATASAKLSRAFKYVLNHEEGLRQYLYDGYIPMTNSLDERVIRPFTTGRKNWLFSASVSGAESSANAYSIIETAKANGLDPYKYLTTIFTYLPSQDLIKNPEIIDEFLPWSKFVQKNCK